MSQGIAVLDLESMLRSLLLTCINIHHFAGLFILNLSKMLKFAATHLPQNDNENEVSAF